MLSNLRAHTQCSITAVNSRHLLIGIGLIPKEKQTPSIVKTLIENLCAPLNECHWTEAPYSKQINSQFNKMQWTASQTWWNVSQSQVIVSVNCLWEVIILDIAYERRISRKNIFVWLLQNFWLRFWWIFIWQMSSF